MTVGGYPVPTRATSTRSSDDLRRDIEARVRSGAYSSADDVIRAGLEALDREEEALTVVMRQRVRDALDDPTQDIPAEVVFGEVGAIRRPG
jgi:antitoxin ParD1/3/4